MTDALLVDVQEARRLLGGISESLTYRLAADGKLPHVRFGRRVLFSVEGLRQWVRENDGRDVTAEGDNRAA